MNEIYEGKRWYMRERDHGVVAGRVQKGVCRGGGREVVWTRMAMRK